MIKFFLIFSFFFCFFKADAQNDTIFYDDDWKVIEEKEEASFYRLWSINIENENYEIIDYYISNQLQCKGAYKSKKEKKKIGKWVWYFINGEKEKEGNYKDGSKIGTFTYWHENGQKAEIRNYDDDLIKYISKWNKDGRIQIENGEGIYTDFWDNNNVYYSGKVVNFLKVGTWKRYGDSGELRNEEIFEKSKFVKGITYKEGKKYPYKIQERLSYFKSCKNDKNLKQEKECTLYEMAKFVGKVNYPKKAIDKNIEGKVIVSFKVDKKGKVVELELLQSAHELLNKAALKHIAKLPRFVPAVQKGIKVKLMYKIPVSFRLE